MQRRDKTVILCLIICVLPVALPVSVKIASAQTYVCAQDLNDDGDIAQNGELADCITTAQGQLCPIGTVDCTGSTKTSDPKCPASTALNNSSNNCEAAPICPSGSAYDPNKKLCTGSVAPSCPSGSWFDGTYNACFMNLMGSSCYICPSGWTLFYCFGKGFFYSVLCDKAVTCSAGTYSSSNKMCNISQSPTCPSGTTFSSSANVCNASPACDSGLTYDPDTHMCSYKSYSCPLGSAYTCMNNNGAYKCSSISCVDSSTITPETTTTDLTGYTDNGTIDPNSGQCLGQQFIFNGKGRECRPPGTDTNLFDCCSNGSGGTLDFLKNCKQSESDTISALDAHRCHSIGSYCVTKWPLIGCVQRSKVYCCFNSQLGRIIQEQGRPQLKKFAPDGQWGIPTAPNCVGFTPEEFQMLDFSKIDFSEYISTINTTVSTQVQQKISDGVNRFFNNTQ